MGNDPRWLLATVAKAILWGPALVSLLIIALYSAIDEWREESQWGRR